MYAECLFLETIVILIAVAFYSNNKIVLIATYIQIYIAVTISNITRIIAPQYNLQL